MAVGVGAKEVGEPLQKEGGEIRKRYSYTLVEKVNLKFITQTHYDLHCRQIIFVPHRENGGIKQENTLFEL